jgi:hypothetical protein
MAEFTLKYGYNADSLKEMVQECLQGLARGDLDDAGQRRAAVILDERLRLLENTVSAMAGTINALYGESVR